MEHFVDALTHDPALERHVAYRGLAEGRAARLREPVLGWSEDARHAVRALGIEALYEHQARALEAAASGHNVLLATPTASGKTLAYLLAFLARRAADPQARALFVYPLKALARDQLAAIRRFLRALGLPPEAAAEVYDGDTPEALRRRIRRKPPAILVTNPDMLHLGILPSHDNWEGFLRHLGLVAVDEAHVYRGVFGAHVHHVLRRLLRLARLHGAAPRLVAGSATIGDAGSFIETLCGEPFEVILESGAPRAPRHVLFMQPETVSPYTLATRVLARTVGAGHKTIAFTKARRITELMHQWLREQEPGIASRVASYRSGYLPEERRAIEARLFEGDLDGVISTSALEAGIDVGGLDVCVLVGYPGSLATAWQRIGRAGRGDRASLAVLVAMPDALDRYVVAHPGHFFSGDFERVVLDPENDVVADAHLQAAGAERSLDPVDLEFLAGEGGPARVARLVNEGKLIEAHDDERWFSLRRRPQREIPLRASGQPFTLRHAGTGRHLGTLDEGRAWFEGHPGAIYLHAGQSYLALDLDPDERVVLLEPTRADHFTQVFASKETEILERLEERAIGAARVSLGRLRVTTTIEGYAKKRLFTQEEISRHPLEGAPPQVLETMGFWFTFPEGVLARLVDDERHPFGALHAMEHAAIGLFPLLAICDRWDLGGISYARHPQEEGPSVFVYDGYAGGVGLARTGFARAEQLVARTREHVAACSCEDGCPACVISPKCGAGNHPLDKLGAVDLLELLEGRRELLVPEGREDDVAHALVSHRSRVHAGVRGGGRFEPGEKQKADSVTKREPGASSGAGDPEAPRWPEGLEQPESLLREDEGRWVFFDLETLRSADEVGGWGNIRDMGLALAVTLDSSTGAYTTWRQEQAAELVDTLRSADRVVGFNLDRFDVTVLEGEVSRRLEDLKTLDLLSEIRSKIGFRLSLGHLAQETLGADKGADGLQSLAWVREGRFDLIERYCRGDVLLTAALWAHGRSKGYVVFRSKTGIKGRIPVVW